MSHHTLRCWLQSEALWAHINRRTTRLTTGQRGASNSTPERLPVARAGTHSGMATGRIEHKKTPCLVIDNPQPTLERNGEKYSDHAKENL